MQDPGIGEGERLLDFFPTKCEKDGHTELVKYDAPACVDPILVSCPGELNRSWLAETLTQQVATTGE